MLLMTVLMDMVSWMSVPGRRPTTTPASIWAQSGVLVFTDLLNMGVRGMEIDPWWCFDKMLMSHDDGKQYRGCAPWDRKYDDGIKENRRVGKQARKCP